MGLQEWLQNGWLRSHRSSREEIRNLLSISDRDLKDCQARNISNDNRFTMAYNAALQAATAALAASGYRVERGGQHHYRTLDSLELTIKAAPHLISRLNVLRKKRSFNLYEMEGAVSDSDLKEMIQVATDLRRNVEKWLRQNYSELL